MYVEKTPFKGVFMRFNGFSKGGWYIDTTIQKQTLKTPENTIKHNFGILLKNHVKKIIVYINKNTIKR